MKKIIFMLKKCLTRIWFSCRYCGSCWDANADCKQHGKFRQDFLFEGSFEFVKFDLWKLVSEWIE